MDIYDVFINNNFLWAFIKIYFSFWFSSAVSRLLFILYLFGNKEKWRSALWAAGKEAEDERQWLSDSDVNVTLGLTFTVSTGCDRRAAPSPRSGLGYSRRQSQRVICWFFAWYYYPLDINKTPCWVYVWSGLIIGFTSDIRKCLIHKLGFILDHNLQFLSDDNKYRAVSKDVLMSQKTLEVWACTKWV